MSGDYRLEDSVYILFTTRAFATGIPGVLSASTVAVYEDVTAAPIETSIAVTETLNSINGLNAVTIAALAASGYNAGGHYHVVIEAGTVGGVSVVGEVVGSFSIGASDAAQNTSGLTFTVAGQVDANAQYWNDTVISTTLETSADMADAVWDETLAGHVTADTAGLLLNDWQDGGRLDLIQDIIAVDTTTDIPALIADVPTVAEFNARTLVAASYFDPAADAVANVTLVATTTTNTDMVGTDSALLASSAPTNFGDLSISVTTGLVDITQTAADKAWGTAARILTASTNFNDVSTAEVNTQCDLAISDAALATATNLATVDTVVDNLNLGIIYGAAATGTLAIGSCTSDLTGYTDDQLIGRVIIFTAGPADGEGTDILDYASASGLLTFTDLTLAPEDGDTFKIV